MSILAFQMPNQVVMQKADNFQGLFEFKPLERGYGVTIGNALRRILLSSLEGYAIVGVHFPNIPHEFTSIEGVIEDITQIVLNLKQVRFKRLSESPETEVSIDIKGKKELKAGDIIQFTNCFEILNPDFVICRMDTSVRLQLDLTLSKGRGYVAAEEQLDLTKPLGFIAIDAIFTPVKNVKYSIENTRVEQRTDFEKLILNIKTDGSVHPEDALKEAATILIQHFMLFSDRNMTFQQEKKEQQEPIDEEFLHMRKLLKTPLADIDLSVRAFNCLKAANVRTLGDLVKLEISDMMKFRNFGKKSLTELEQLIEDRKLSFGMNISKYKLDEG